MISLSCLIMSSSFSLGFFFTDIKYSLQSCYLSFLVAYNKYWYKSLVILKNGFSTSSYYNKRLSVCSLFSYKIKLHFGNSVQPHQLVNGSTLFVYLIWVLNDYQGELAFLRVPSGTITGTIRDNHEFYDMPEWLPGRILKIQGTEYHTVRCRFFFPILYQVYYIYTFTSFTLYVIREEKDFFFNISAFKMHFFSSKICISLK